jgi:hypothetical protein
LDWERSGEFLVVERRALYRAHRHRFASLDDLSGS